MTVESDSSPECFSQMMASMPGFRFHPTDEELIMYYLKRKMAGRKLKLNVIRETDVYKWDPEELPGQSMLKTGDRQWFFFSPRDRKYPNAARSNRGTRHGYWKATGKDRNVTCNSRTVGLKKTLVFYKGRAPNGQRTDWVMHEYTMDETELQRWQGFKDYFALYKLYKKSGAGPKNGEQYGAPFNEDEWVDDDFVDFNIKSADSEVPTQQLCVTSVDVVTANDHVQPLSDDEIEDIVKRIMDDESLFDQVVSEGTQSDVVDQFFREIAFPEPNRTSYPSFQQHQVETSSNFTQSVISHLQMSEAPVVISAPDIQGKELSLREDDFLEFDDLVGPEHALPNVNMPGEILQFEDGLSELDLYHDTQMFLHDVCQETVSQPYMNALDTSNIVNQGYELLCTQEDAIQTSGELWIPADFSEGSLSLPISGAVPECVSFPTESNEIQSDPVGGFEASRFSSSLWDFVDSIPTTPASASENSSVNRACEIMSSFKKLKDSNKNTHGTEGNATTTMKKAGRKGSVYFLFFPVLVALCAFLWVSIGTTLLGGCKSW